MIILILIVIATTIGITFAFLASTATQTNPNTMTTSCFNITFGDSNGSNLINLNTAGHYAYPMTEQVALSKITPYTFTVTNNCTVENSSSNMDYVVTLSSITGQTSNLKNYLKYKLNKTNTPTVTGTATNLTNTTYVLPASTISTYGLDTTYELGRGTLAPGASATYSLYLWIADTADNTVMNKSFTGKLIVYVNM